MSMIEADDVAAEPIIKVPVPPVTSNPVTEPEPAGPQVERPDEPDACRCDEHPLDHEPEPLPDAFRLPSDDEWEEAQRDYRVHFGDQPVAVYPHGAYEAFLGANMRSGPLLVLLVILSARPGVAIPDERLHGSRDVKQAKKARRKLVQLGLRWERVEGGAVYDVAGVLDYAWLVHQGRVRLPNDMRVRDGHEEW